jgi:uncharacterized protein YwqG
VEPGDGARPGQYATYVGCIVELEVEELRRRLDGEAFDWKDPNFYSAASTWQLLLQVASEDDADMMWGTPSPSKSPNLSRGFFVGYHLLKRRRFKG